MSHFLKNDDAGKSFIFRSHTDLWTKIEKEVQQWTLANWHKWEVEKPEWFTEHFKECVPNHFIPKTALEVLHEEAGGERRRFSILPARMSSRPLTRQASTRQEEESRAGAGAGEENMEQIQEE